MSRKFRESVKDDFQRSVAAYQRQAVKNGLDELLGNKTESRCESSDSSVDDAPYLVKTDSNYFSPPPPVAPLLIVPFSPKSAAMMPSCSPYEQVSPHGVARELDADIIPPTPAIFMRINNYSKLKIVCQVQFKHNFRYCMVTVPSKLIRTLKLGDFVITEGEKNQEDLGVITNAYSVEDFHLMRSYVGLSQDAEENTVGNILRLATMADRMKLPKKMNREEMILQLCRDLAVNEYHLSMNIYGVEYQFDGLKLSVYYTSDARVDYREFAQDLFSRFRTKIWMRKTNQCSVFIPKPFATRALQTGDNAFEY